MSETARLLIAVATYNEIENLPPLVQEIFDHVPQSHVLVIDDNSPDGTGRWCDQHAREEGRLRCLHRPAKLGLGTATIAGFRYAIEHGYELVTTMDADFSHPPRFLPSLLRPMVTLCSTGSPGSGSALPGQLSQRPIDVMIGSRYVPGGRIEGWPLYRRLMSRLVNSYARLMLGLPVRDCSGAFRCYRTAALARLDLDHIRSRGYAYLEEILWHLQRVGARMEETPITFVDRQQGQTKINLAEAISAVGIIFRLGLRHRLGI